MWPRFINAAVGIWLMAAPSVLGYDQGVAELVERIFGPLLATCAIIAMWQVTRPLRWGSVIAGASLLAAPWLFGFEAVIVLNEMLCGAVAIAMGLIKGDTTLSYGGGWKAAICGERDR